MNLYIILGITCAVCAVTIILSIYYYRNKTLTKAEFSSLWAGISFGLSIYGIFLFSIFLGVLSIILGAVAVYYGLKDREVHIVLKILAFIGIYLGALELGFGIAGMMGLIPS